MSTHVREENLVKHPDVNIFSLSLNVFYPIRDKYEMFSHIYLVFCNKMFSHFVVCKCAHFGYV